MGHSNYKCFIGLHGKFIENGLFEIAIALICDFVLPRDLLQKLMDVMKRA